MSSVLIKQGPHSCTPLSGSLWFSLRIHEMGETTPCCHFFEIWSASEKNSYIQSNTQRILEKKLLFTDIRIFIWLGRCKQPVSKLFFHRWRERRTKDGGSSLSIGFESDDCKCGVLLVGGRHFSRWPLGHSGNDSPLQPLGGTVITIFTDKVKFPA